jgi:hypothetical protein
MASCAFCSWVCAELWLSEVVEDPPVARVVVDALGEHAPERQVETGREIGEALGLAARTRHGPPMATAAQTTQLNMGYWIVTLFGAAG